MSNTGATMVSISASGTGSAAPIGALGILAGDSEEQVRMKYPSRSALYLVALIEWISQCRFMLGGGIRSS
jgi:hypothetical protein